MVHITRRTATTAEIVEHFALFNRPRIRHFTKEIYCRRGRNGVAHRKYTSAKIFEQDGKVFAKLQGRVQELTADHCIYSYESGARHEHVLDLRIKSEYLPWGSW